MDNLVDKSAAKEAITDVGVGFFMAFPVALAVLSFSTWIGLGVYFKPLYLLWFLCLENIL